MKLRIPVVLAALLAVAACDSEPPELSEREALGMLKAIFDVMYEVEVFWEGDKDTATCPQGGTATVEVISYAEDLAEDTTLFDDMVSIKPSACWIPLGGSIFTVNGSPDVRLHIKGWILEDDDFSLDWRLFGTFAWDKESEGGARCEVSLEAEEMRLDGRHFTIDGTFRGDLCGFDATVDSEDLFQPGW